MSIYILDNYSKCNIYLWIIGFICQIIHKYKIWNNYGFLKAKKQQQGLFRSNLHFTVQK